MGNWNLGYPTRDQLAARTLEFSKAIRAVDPAARLVPRAPIPKSSKSGTPFNSRIHPARSTICRRISWWAREMCVPSRRLPISSPPPHSPSLSNWSAACRTSRSKSTPPRDTQARLTSRLLNALYWRAPQRAQLYQSRRSHRYWRISQHANAEFLDRPHLRYDRHHGFGGIWKKRSQVYATPAYYAFKMYAGAEAAKRISATANSGAYSVAQGVDRLPDISGVPYLDVVATLSQDGRRLTLFCVNRSLDTDIPSNIRLNHFDPRRTASVHLLSSASINDVNDEINPENVEPVDTTEANPSTGWSHVFPHESVTVIAIDRK